MMSERHEVEIFVHVNEPKAKEKQNVARPSHKVVAKDMGQKNRGDRPRASENVYRGRLTAVAVREIGKCRQVNKARSLPPPVPPVLIL